MTNFKSAIRFVLMNEGGYSNNKHDKGGATNYGISTRFLKLTDEDINEDGHIDQTDIEGLTESRAIDLYKVYFWDQYKLVNLFDLRIAAKCLDLFVNMRGISAGKIIQHAVNDQGGCLIVDGLLGKKSFSAINRISYNSYKCDDLMDGIRERQADFYRAIVDHDKSQKTFLKGWLARAKR